MSASVGRGIPNATTNALGDRRARSGRGQEESGVAENANVQSRVNKTIGNTGIVEWNALIVGDNSARIAKQARIIGGVEVAIVDGNRGEASVATQEGVTVAFDANVVDVSFATSND